MLTGEEHYGRLTLDCHLTPPAVATKRGMARGRRSWSSSWRRGGPGSTCPGRMLTLPAVPERGRPGRRGVGE